jgi:predicted kinase
MTSDEKRLARMNAVRNRDADRLEASLGRLPEPASEPGLVILVGLPGSGKSHLARAIARRYPAAILDSDAMRQALFPEPEHSEREHHRLFPALHVLVDRLLGRGIPVVLDATNLKEANRRPLYQIAKRHGAKAVLVRVWAPKAVIRTRLAGRTGARDADDRSTATLDVYERMLADVEPIRRRHVSVNTAKEIGPAVDRIIGLLQS